MNNTMQWWERLECRPLDSGSGALSAAQPVFNIASKACVCFILQFHHILFEAAVYIFFVCVF